MTLGVTCITWGHNRVWGPSLASGTLYSPPDLEADLDWNFIQKRKALLFRDRKNDRNFQ